MFNTYRKLLSKPGALAFSSAGGIARLPQGMIAISVILLISNMHDQYSLAGRVAAVFVVAQAVCAPQLAKLIDIHGQARVMRPSLLVAAISLSTLTFLAVINAPQMTLYLAAAFSGATIGSMGALVRSRWSALVTSSSELHVAFSLESVLDELVWVAGPMLATFLVTSIAPPAGMILAIATLVIGGFWFLSLRSTEPPVAGVPTGGKRASIISPGLIMVALVFVSMGLLFGSSDVSTIAYATAQGKEHLAGALLGVFAFGSLLSGFIHGTRKFVGPIWKRFVIGITLLALGSSLFAFVFDLRMLAAAMFVAGFAIAPTIISGNGVVQQMVPPERLTEGLTWLGTSIGIGFAIGTSVAGAVIDAYDPHSGFLVVTAAAFTSLLLALLSIPILRKS